MSAADWGKHSSPVKGVWLFFLVYLALNFPAITQLRPFFHNSFIAQF